jgi:tRNA G18 (ribose-2'-O)-methylase SpoU
MRLVQLRGSDDPRAREYRDLSDHERIRQRGLFVAEGRLVVRRVIESGRFQIRSVMVSETARKSLANVLEQLADSVPVLVCESGAFEHITGYNIHRGCLALVERPIPVPLEAALADARLVVVLEAVANPDNVGGVFRNAAAFGADAVLLGPGCTDPLYRKAVRTSMSAVIRVPFVMLDALPDGLAPVRARGFRIVALTPHDVTDTLDGFAARPRPPRLALVVGAEGAGLSQAVLAAADDRVRIPIRPEVDSLNLAVAAAIALYRLASG